MIKIGVKVLREDKQQIEGELILKKEKMYISKNKKLRVEIIWLYYNILTTGYRKRWKMTELVTKNYQQLEVTKDVGKYIDSCNIYQRMKNQTETLAVKLKLSEILKKL